MKKSESNHELYIYKYIGRYDGMQMHYKVVFFCYVVKIRIINHISVIRWIMPMSLNAINRVKHRAAHKTAWFPYSNSIYKNDLLKKTMRFAFTLIAFFSLISIAYGNSAVDEKKKESGRQGKIN